MAPILEIGGAEFSTWLLCLALGIVSLGIGATCLNYFKHHDWKVLPDLSIWLLLAALFGTRLAYVAANGKDFREAFDLFQPGYLSVGAMPFALLVLWGYSVSHRIPFLRLLDLIAPFAPLMEAIGHVGCFLAGCCFGCVSLLPWAISFPAHSRAFQHQLNTGLLSSQATVSLPVHPTQLYCVVASLAIFAILLSIALRSTTPGLPALCFLFCTGVLRFTVQFFRGDEAPMALGLRIPQLVFLGLSVLALCWGIFLYRKKRSTTLTLMKGFESCN